MRKVIVVLAIPVVLVAALAAYLFVTTPKNVTAARLPLTPGQRELLRSVPSDAEAFAFIPTAASAQRKLEANPITRRVIEKWRTEQGFPAPWMLGNADLVMWREGKITSYGLRLDPVRALLVRIYLMFAGRADGRPADFVVNSPSAHPIAPELLDRTLALADPNAEYDAIAIQFEGGRQAYPPVARPTLTLVRLEEKVIDLVSLAQAESTVTPPQFRAQFPAGALLSVAFAEPPRTLRDLDRLLAGSINQLGSRGGLVALYDVNTGTLLPRPKGVLVLDGSARELLGSSTAQAIASVGEIRDTGSQILVSADRESVPLYIKDRIEPATWPANLWAARLDPQRLAPVLEDVSRSPGLRILAGRVQRSARDLRKWVGELRGASTVEAAMSTAGGTEELRVRLVSR